MKLADLHIHSKYSIEPKIHLWNLRRVTIEKILEKAKERELSAIAISDHDNIEASFQAEKLAKKYKIVIIPAIEITSKDGHILAYGVKKNIKPRMSAQETIEEIHRQGGLAVAAHPFFQNGLSCFYSLRKRKYISLLPIDGIEAVSCVTNVSQKAKKVAKILNLAVVGGSDAHCLPAIGFGLTVFPDSCNKKEDYLAAIRKRKTFVFKDKGTRTAVFLKTLFESRLRPSLGI